MTPDLTRSMSGFEVIALDSASRIACCALVTADGRYLKLSGIAAVLATGMRDGKTLEDIATMSSTSSAAVEQICAALASKLDMIRLVPANAAPRGFVAHRRVLSAPRVRMLAAPLSRLCGPRAMSVLGVSSVAITLALLWSSPATKLSVGTLWAGYLACIPVLLVHELGHASTCHRYGAPVGPIGVALYLIYPAFYCDVTAAWRLSRWQRLAIDVGGVYFQAIVTAVVAIAWRLTGSTTLHAIAALSTGAAITNLIPFFALDGYWVLSDAVGVVNLREQRRAVLARLWCYARRRPVRVSPWPVTTTVIVVLYSIVSIVFTAYVAARLLPRGVAQLRVAPFHAVALYRSVSVGHGHAALSAAAGLATAVLMVIVAFALARRAARPFTHMTRQAGAYLSRACALALAARRAAPRRAARSIQTITPTTTPHRIHCGGSGDTTNVSGSLNRP